MKHACILLKIKEDRIDDYLASNGINFLNWNTLTGEQTIAKEPGENTASEIQSFEIAEGDSFGDMISKDRVLVDEPLRIGLFVTGFF